MLLELDLAPYRIGEWPLKKHVDRAGNRLFVLAGNTVLLVDLGPNTRAATAVVVNQLNYVEEPVLQGLLASGHLTGNSYAFGPVRGVGATIGFDYNSKTDAGYNSKKRMVVAQRPSMAARWQRAARSADSSAWSKP